MISRNRPVQSCFFLHQIHSRLYLYCFRNGHYTYRLRLTPLSLS